MAVATSRSRRTRRCGPISRASAVSSSRRCSPPAARTTPTSQTIVRRARLAGEETEMSTMRMLSRTAAIALLGTTVFAPNAANAQVMMPVAPQSQPVVLRGATIHTVTKGTIQNGTIVLENGKITAIGTDVQVPRAAKVVDLTGKHIYPGLIDAYSTVGLTEIGAVDVSNDIRERGDFNPNVRAEVAVNAESRHIGTTRSAGVLVAFSTPEGGVISGLSSAMSLEGWTWEEMSMKGRSEERRVGKECRARWW